MYNSNDVADRIRLSAKNAGIIIKDMLTNIGLGENTLHNMNASMPRADNLAKIADYLNVSVDYLLGRTESKPESAFYERYVKLCAQKGVSVSTPPLEIGMSNAAQTDWKNGSVPRLSSLKKLADYFGVPIAYFTGDAPAEISQEDAELLQAYHALSADGRAKLLEYAEMLQLKEAADNMKANQKGA